MRIISVDLVIQAQRNNALCVLVAGHVFRRVTALEIMVTTRKQPGIDFRSIEDVVVQLQAIDISLYSGAPGTLGQPNPSLPGKQGKTGKNLGIVASKSP